MHHVLALLLGCIALACGSAREKTPHAGASPRAAEPPSGTPAWTGAHETRSALGTYLVRWRPSLDPVVEGETFAIDAWVFDATAPEAPLIDVKLDVDAGMPQHGHGMAAFARHARLEDGGWRAEGLRFHMSGRWELTFDVARGPRAERAQVGVELD